MALFVKIVGGYRLIYDRMCPMTQWVIDEEMIEKVGHPVNTEESLAVKILIKVSTQSRYLRNNLSIYSRLMNVNMIGSR